MYKIIRQKSETLPSVYQTRQFHNSHHVILILTALRTSAPQPIY